MASVESVKAKLNGLIDSANAVTGKKDGDLTSAVNSLIAGFGGQEDSAQKITVATSAATADVVYNTLKAMAPAENNFHVFLFDGDAAATGVQNQCAILVAHPLLPAGAFYVRYRDGAYNANIPATSSFDLVLSPGDTFIYWGASI